MNRYIGRRGEGIIRTLCSDSQVTCNKSEEDDHGWDFHLEFPPQDAPDVAVDMRPGPLSALVQVKTTSGSRFSWQIKLSNALRLVNSELPCFLVLVRLGKKEARQIYVVHIWKDLISIFLKAGREADAEQRRATHKEMVSVTFSPDDEQSEDPIRWMRGQIDSVGSDYAGQKRKLRISAGYEDGYGIGKVTFDVQSADELVDWQLGLQESVKISCLEVTSKRFGILAGKPDVYRGPGRLFVYPPKRVGTLRLSLVSGETLLIPAEVLSGELPGLPETYMRWRVRAGCLDIIFGGNGRASGKATIQMNERVPLARIVEFAALMMPASSPVELQISIDEMRIDLGRLEFDGPCQGANWTHIHNAARALQEITRVAAGSVISLAMAEVLHAMGDFELQGRGVLSPFVLTSVLASEWPTVLQFQPSDDAPTSFSCLLAYSLADVGDHRFGCLVERQILEDKSINGRRHIKFGSARVIESFIGAAGSCSVESKLEVAYEKRLNQKSNDTVLAIRNIRNCIEKAKVDNELVIDRPIGNRRQET